MASFNLQGAVGAVTASTSTATPAFGTGQSRALGNLLICWATQELSGGTLSPTTISAGWTQAVQQTGTNTSAAVFYKIASGGDAAPTVTGTTGQAIDAQLSEFIVPLGFTPIYDQSGGATGTTSSQTGTAAAPDTTTTDMLCAAGAVRYSVGGTKALGLNSNHLVSYVVTDNNSTIQTSHYIMGYGFSTTTGAAADTSNVTFPTSNITEASVAFASFALMPTVSPRAALALQAVERAAYYMERARSGLLRPRRELWRPELVIARALA